MANLNGTKISTELCSMTSLEILDLENTKISGTIPTHIANLKNLRRLYIGQNQLSGSIPTEVRRIGGDDLFISHIA